MALVDSGTDVTMMDLEIATILGMDLTNAKKGTAAGVGGTQHAGFLGKLNLQVEGFDEVLIFTAVFVENLGFDIILGQDDFFRRFHVRFERQAEAFYLQLAP